MANNSGAQFQNTSPFHCKECNVFLNSAESLEVHLQYHKENLLNKWATQTPHQPEESNNNNNNNNQKALKREFIPNNTLAAAADSSECKKSPEYSRTTPETIFGHPPTPQSYQSAASPYQNHDNTSAFSPNFQSYLKQEPPASPPQYQNNYAFSEQYFGLEHQHTYAQEFPVHKPALYRYHPYQQPYERAANAQVSSSSPAYPPQPTPSPSPKQCDKCGYVCDSAPQLMEHVSLAHPTTPYHPNQHFVFNEHQIKEEDTQSEILDLDSHKVHQVYPEEEKQRNGEHNTGLGVNTLVNPWSQQQKLYQSPPTQFLGAPHQGHLPSQEFITTTPEASYRSYEHVPTPNTITSSQVASTPPQTQGGGGSASGTKSSNWKSNEARRPKTYNCTACNKWFTSSGHLKRHYNTTLHKNAVKSSGQPDPASLPISAHHHPARESASNKEELASPTDEDTNSLPSALLQQLPPHLNGGSPNGDAGLSPTSLDTRGLLPLSTVPNGFGMPPHMMPPMENSQFQMYPNESAPHVTQDTVVTTNNLNITGEYQIVNLQENNHQPLPSFAQFTAHRYGLLMSYGNANVGGGGPATAPFSYSYPECLESADNRPNNYAPDEEDYRLTLLTAADTAPDPNVVGACSYSAPSLDLAAPLSPEKAHTKREFDEHSHPQVSSTVKLGTYKCIDCDKTFNKACYLTQHNKTFHSGDKPFKCGRCGKRFSNQRTHEEHASKHAGDKPHKCDMCPKQFNHKTDLRRHMCLHTGQKPFICETCGKGFIRKDHMLKHCETHFRKTQNRMSR